MSISFKVKNMPENPERYVVAKFSDDTHELWFWGSYNDIDRAKAASIEVGGIIGVNENYGE